MMEEKAAAGRRALGAWMKRCKAEVGDVCLYMFKRPMSALVDSLMLYGVEIWGAYLEVWRQYRTSTEACLSHVLWAGHLTH